MRRTTGTYDHCDSRGIVTIGDGLLCREHTLQAVAEKSNVHE